MNSTQLGWLCLFGLNVGIGAFNAWNAREAAKKGYTGLYVLSMGVVGLNFAMCLYCLTFLLSL